MKGGLGAQRGQDYSGLPRIRTLRGRLEQQAWMEGMVVDWNTVRGCNSHR